MSKGKNPARGLPAVQKVLEEADARGLVARFGHGEVVSAIRAAVAAARGQLLAGAGTPSPSAAELLAEAAQRLEASDAPRLKPAVNATGILLHTGLGRAPMARAAREAVASVMGCCNLQMDMDDGSRIHREHAVRGLVCSLTGAEDVVLVAGAPDLGFDDNLAFSLAAWVRTDRTTAQEDGAAIVARGTDGGEQREGRSQLPGKVMHPEIGAVGAQLFGRPCGHGSAPGADERKQCCCCVGDELGHEITIPRRRRHHGQDLPDMGDLQCFRSTPAERWIIGLGRTGGARPGSCMRGHATDQFVRGRPATAGDGVQPGSGDLHDPAQPPRSVDDSTPMRGRLSRDLCWRHPDRDLDVVPEFGIGVTMEAEVGDAAVARMPRPTRARGTEDGGERIDGGLPEVEPVAVWPAAQRHLKVDRSFGQVTGTVELIVDLLLERDPVRGSRGAYCRELSSRMPGGGDDVGPGRRDRSGVLQSDPGLGSVALGAPDRGEACADPRGKALGHGEQIVVQVVPDEQRDVPRQADIQSQRQGISMVRCGLERHREGVLDLVEVGGEPDVVRVPDPVPTGQPRRDGQSHRR